MPTQKSPLNPSITLLIALGLFATIAAPLHASAQCTASTAAHTYVPLAAATVLSTDVDDGQFEVTLPFPIAYAGTTYTTISVGANGAVAFPGGTSISLGNSAPGPSGLDNFVAAFWDDLRIYPANGGYIGWEAGGTAPARTFTVEWNSISRFGSSGVVLSMQMRFFEGSSRIEIDYGPITGSATFSSTMGLDGPGGAGALLFAPSMCTTNCTQADYNSLASMRVTVTCL